MGKIIVIGSQKGGVGKTTTTLNLAYSLREMGKKVLTVDFDSQANLTTCYGIEDTGALEYSIGHLMMNDLIKPFKDMVDRGALYTKVALQFGLYADGCSDLSEVCSEET